LTIVFSRGYEENLHPTELSYFPDSRIALLRRHHPRGV